MRIIYDERRGDTITFFLVAGGGMLAISAIAFLHEVIGVPPQQRLVPAVHSFLVDFFLDVKGVPPQQRLVPEVSAEVWAAGWEAAGLAGAIFLIFGLLIRAGETRIAVDERGIKKLRSWGGDCFLIEWANVRSWWVESYEKTSYVTVTRLVVELASTEKPFVVEDARYQTAVVAELSAVVPMRRSRDVSAMDQACMTPPDTLTHSGFRWVEGSGGYRLDFPLPDRQPHHAVTLWLCLGTLGAALVLGILVATENPFGDRFTLGIWGLLAVGGLFSVMCLLDDAQRRSAFNRCIACLDIGPEFVTVEDRAGREQKWRRAAIHSVRVDRHITGDSEPGNSQVFYEVMLCFHDGSSLSVWGRVTRDDFPFFRETEFSETNIRAAVAWLSTTLRQVLGLPATNEAVKFNG